VELAWNCIVSEKVEKSHKKENNIKLSPKKMGFIIRSVLTQSRVQPLALNTLEF